MLSVAALTERLRQTERDRKNVMINKAAKKGIRGRFVIERVESLTARAA